VNLIDPKWFEMADIRRRLYSKSVWIPIRESLTIPALSGAAREVYATGSVGFPEDKRKDAEKLG